MLETGQRNGYFYAPPPVSAQEWASGVYDCTKAAKPAQADAGPSGGTIASGSVGSVSDAIAKSNAGLKQRYDSVLARMEAGEKFDAVGPLVQICRDGYADACTYMGNSYALSFDPPRPIDAFDMFETGCKFSDGESCGMMGVMLQSGEFAEIPVDKSRAASMFDKACSLGSHPSCGELGILMMTDEGGVERNLVKGMELMVAACRSRKHMDSCGEASFHLYKGTVPKDDVLARELSEIGCVAGNMNSCNVRGDLLMWARGGPQDVDGARAAFKTVCDATGDNFACYNMGAQAPSAADVAAAQP